MANKAALTAALLLVLVALASATRPTTYTTTTIDDEANRRGQQQQCLQQIQGRQFQSCQRYISQRGSNQYELKEEEEEVMGNPGQQQSRYLRDCCQQLQNVNEQCRCEAIRHAVRQVQQGGSKPVSLSRCTRRLVIFPDSATSGPSDASSMLSLCR